MSSTKSTIDDYKRTPLDYEIASCGSLVEDGVFDGSNCCSSCHNNEEEMDEVYIIHPTSGNIAWVHCCCTFTDNWRGQWSYLPEDLIN